MEIQFKMPIVSTKTVVFVDEKSSRPSKKGSAAFFIWMFD